MAETQKLCYDTSSFYMTSSSLDTSQLTQQLQDTQANCHVSMGFVVDPRASFSGSVSMTSSTTRPEPFFSSCSATSTQYVLQDTVEQKAPIPSQLPSGLQIIAPHNIQASKTLCHSLPTPLPVVTSAAESFLFGPSEDSGGYNKEHSQLMCVPEGSGETMSLPIRTSFADSNPLTPARSKACEYSDQGAPLTPTANLKVLLSAASPAIREREMMQQTARNVCRSILSDAAVNEELEEYSRKQKSLSLLCSKFLEAAESGEIGKNGIFTIEEAATKLDINRRRVYDIVNVLESLEMVSKQKIKNEYKWHGRNHLVQTLARLKEQDTSGSQSDNSCTECGQEYGGQEYVPRSEKSLGFLCQKFVVLFLEAPERELTLEAAARILLGEEGKVRRLYDVANILTSLGLISKKVFAGGTNFRKPGFYWSGPVILPKRQGGRSKSDSAATCGEEEYSKKAHRITMKPLANRNSVLSPMENLPAMKTRSPQSAPSSPVKQKTPFKRYLSYDTTTKKKRSHSSSSKAPEVRKFLKLSPSEVPESEVKEFEDQFYALLGKFPSIAQRLSEIQPKQDSPTGVFSAAKKVVSPDIVQSSMFSMFQDSKPTPANTAAANSVTWSSALSELAPAAKSQSPSTTTVASRTLSTHFPMSKGIVPISCNPTAANVTPSTLQLVSNSITTISDGLITVTPLYTLPPPPASSLLQAPTNSTKMSTSVAASLLSAACKQTPSGTTPGFRIPTIGQLLQSSQLLTLPQKTEQNP